MKILYFSSFLFIASIGFLDGSQADGFEPVVSEDNSLKIVSRNVKLCDGFCNPVRKNNRKVIPQGILEVSGFPGVERERVWRFENQLGFCGDPKGYDCSASGLSDLKRRSEVQTKKNSMGVGDTGIYKWKMFIPEEIRLGQYDFTRPVQIHQDKGEGNWAIGILEKKLVMHSIGRFGSEVVNLEIYDSGKFQGRWLDFEVYMKHETDPKKGAFRLLVDGKVIYECDPCQTKPFGDGFPKKNEKHWFGFGAHTNKNSMARKWDPDSTQLKYEERFVVFFRDIALSKMLPNGKMKQYFN